MQKESLSVGNYVMYKGEKFIISKAEAIEYADKFTPIVLNVEILMAFGFKYNEQFNTLILFVGVFTLEFMDGCICMYGKKIKIRYLHELQNFYRLLSGGLELKLIDI